MAKPPTDPVDSAFATMRHIIGKTVGAVQPETAETRIRALERLCREVLQFARVAEFPHRVVDALNAASKGHPLLSESLLPITEEDFTREAPAVALGRAGGLKGGKARADSLSARRRREIARKAAVTRWRKR